MFDGGIWSPATSPSSSAPTTRARWSAMPLPTRGVPSVIAGRGSVYATPAGEDWLILLEALEQPHRSRPGAGCGAHPVPRLDRHRTRHRRRRPHRPSSGHAAELGAGARRARRRRAARGRRHRAGPAGQAARPAGRRPSADRPAARRAGAAGRRRARRSRPAGAGRNGCGAGGTKPPSTWQPTASAGWTATPPPSRWSLCTPARDCSSRSSTCHSRSTDGSRSRTCCCCTTTTARRVLDVGGQASTGRVDRQRRAATEQAGEALRLLYVGLTRAQSQVVTWWAPSSNTEDSGLHRLLFGRAPAGDAVPGRAGSRPTIRRRPLLAALAARGGPPVEGRGPGRRPGRPARRGPAADLRSSACSTGSWTPPGAARPTARCRGRRRSRRRTPGSAANRRTASGTTRPRRRRSPTAGGRSGAAARVPSPMADLPAGTSFGTLVHAVLETTDPTAPDLLAELRLRSAEQLARRPAGIERRASWPTGCCRHCPRRSGPIAAGLRAGEIAGRGTGWPSWTSRSRSPAATVPTTSTQPAPWASRPLLRRQLPADDPLAGVRRAAGIRRRCRGSRCAATSPAASTRCFRLPGPRYVVADYKTNWLGAAASRCRPGTTGRRR